MNNPGQKCCSMLVQRNATHLDRLWSEGRRPPFTRINHLNFSPVGSPAELGYFWRPTHTANNVEGVVFGDDRRSSGVTLVMQV